MPTNTYLLGADRAALKAVPMERLPDTAFRWYTPHITGDEGNVETYYVRVPWLNRAVDLRASAVAALPFAIVRENGEEYDTSDDYQNKAGCMPNPAETLYLVEAALSVLGRAYLFNLRNSRKSLDLRYLLPTSVEPVMDVANGLTGFMRNVGARTYPLDVEDIVYFWKLDPFVELGPGNNSAGMAALSAAGVVYNVDEFAEKFFERGAIKVTLLTVKGAIQKEERERVKTWWQKVFTGISRAWSTDIVQAEAIEPVVVGEGIKELSDTSLTKEKREDIAAAFGIPMTLLWSTQAGGLGGGGVVAQDDFHFYDKTIVPEAKFIAGVLTEQVFKPMGLRFVFRPETLDVFQADEAQRAQAFKTYTDAGLKKSVVARMLGLELPEGIEYDDLDGDDDEPEQPPQFGQEQPGQPPQPAPEFIAQQQAVAQAAAQRAMFDDLRKWRRKAVKRGGVVDFESEYIPADLADAIDYAIDTHGVGVAFGFLAKQAGLDAAEARVREKVNKILSKYLPKFLSAIAKGEAAALAYDDLRNELRASIEPEIVGIAVESGLALAADVGVEFDPAMVQDEAASWARSYTFDLITGLTNTTRNVVQSAVASYAETPGMTRADLESLLSPAFGEYRASMIAVTEVTRAYSQATNMYQSRIRDNAGVEMERVWRTNNDELVCPVCGPLNGVPESEWANEFPDGPPAHVRCRCSTTLRYVGRTS